MTVSLTPALRNKKQPLCQRPCIIRISFILLHRWNRRNCFHLQSQSKGYSTHNSKRIHFVNRYHIQAVLVVWWSFSSFLLSTLTTRSWISLKSRVSFKKCFKITKIVKRKPVEPFFTSWNTIIGDLSTLIYHLWVFYDVSSYLSTYLFNQDVKPCRVNCFHLPGTNTPKLFLLRLMVFYLN